MLVLLIGLVLFSELLSELFMLDVRVLENSMPANFGMSMTGIDSLVHFLHPADDDLING